MSFSQPVSAYMTHPVRSVPPEATLAEVHRLLEELGVSAIPVVDDEGRLLGAVRMGDLMRFAQACHREQHIT